MKKVKRVIIWILISIIVQCGGYFYVDKYYLATNTTVKVKKIEKKTSKEKPDAEVVIPDNAEHINASFDGKYVSYYDEDKLKIVNTKTGDIKDVCFKDGVKLSYYKWISDRNRMLIGEKHNTENGYGFKLSYYDVDKDTKEEVKDLTWGDEDSKIEDIQESTLTNIIYVKVSRGQGKSRLYCINIMKEMKRVPTKVTMIGNIAVLNYDDKLVYESNTYNKLYVTNTDESIAIEGVENPKLLGVDEDDNVYVGDLKDNKITSIYFGKIDNKQVKWSAMPLKTPVCREDIYISKKGKVYINDNLKGLIKEIATNKETAYKGKFLQLYDQGVISISEGKLVKNKFN